MKLAISMYSYNAAVGAGRMDITSFIHTAKEIGADGVELLDFFYRDVELDRAAALRALEETGLPCPIFSVGNNFAKTDPAEREAQLDRIKFGVDEALRFGSGVVRVFAGDVAPGITFDQAREWIVEGLALASTYAATNGLRLALENHGTLAGRGEQVRGLISDVRDRAGNDALGANPDTGNFQLVNQASHEAIREVADRAYMVHFKDFRAARADESEGIYGALNGDRFVGAAVGEGDVNLSACLSELRSAGFDGWLSVEYEGVEAPETAVPRCLTNARKFL